MLAGNHSYSGCTAVNTGTLLVNGDQSAATGVTSVGAATLGGTGTIGGDVILLGGTLAPGSNGVGTLTIAGGLSLDAASGGEFPQHIVQDAAVHIIFDLVRRIDAAERVERSEEHTSELQSLMRISYAVFCLKTKKHITS